MLLQVRTGDSIQSLTENFITNIGVTFPSTVHTIVATGTKLLVDRENSHGVCGLCEVRTAQSIGNIFKINKRNQATDARSRLKLWNFIIYQILPIILYSCRLRYRPTTIPYRQLRLPNCLAGCRLLATNLQTPPPLKPSIMGDAPPLTIAAQNVANRRHRCATAVCW